MSELTYRATTKNWSICFSVSELLGSQIFSSIFSRSLPSSSPKYTTRQTNVDASPFLMLSKIAMGLYQGGKKQQQTQKTQVQLSAIFLLD